MRGLINSANRCATNSVLQCLHATHELRAKLDASTQSDSGDLDAANRITVARELNSTFLNMDREDQAAPYDPKSLIEALNTHYKTIWPDVQHYAADVLRYVLNALDDDEDPAHKDSADLWALPKKQTVSCSECSAEHVSYSTDFNVNVYLLETTKDLQDYVNGYSESFKVSSGYCDKCETSTELAVTTDITELPTVMCFNVLRVQTRVDNGTRVLTKNSARLQVPENLDCSHISKGALYPNYELYGLITHSGSCTSGHYEAFVKKMSRWYHVNDEAVKNCSVLPLAQPDILSDVCILMYRQIGVPTGCAL